MALVTDQFRALFFAAVESALAQMEPVPRNARLSGLRLTLQLSECAEIRSVIIEPQVRFERIHETEATWDSCGPTRRPAAR